MSAGASDGTVTCTTHDEVATIVVDREGKRNSLTPSMLGGLERIVSDLESSDVVRVVLVTGSGDASFSSGADLSSFAEQTRDSAWRRWVPIGHRVLARLAHLPIPTIAVLRGNAFGGGLELALACDLRLASSKVSVGFPEVGIGTTPGWGGTGRLVAAVGEARARQMILTGLAVPAVQATQWGLITDCAEPTELDDLVATYVAAFRSRGPLAIGLAKQILGALSSTTDHSVEVLEGLAGSLTVTSDDLAEGIEAFRSRRSPQFEGQ